MEIENTDNPATAETEAQEPAKEATSTEQEQPEFTADDAEEGQVQEPEYEEVDYNGNRYKVPKEVAPALMMQADYTRKTQEVAELRKAAEAEREAFLVEKQINDEIFDDAAQHRAINARIRELQNVNPNALQPQQQTQYMIEMMNLKNASDELAGKINYKRSELMALQQDTTAKQLSQAVAELAKPDERLGWSGKYDDTMRASLAATGKEIGLPDHVLNGIREPVIIKALHLAKIGLETLKKQKAAANAKPSQPEAKPVPTVSGVKAKASVDPDKLPMDQWIKYERQRMAKAAGR